MMRSLYSSWLLTSKEPKVHKTVAKLPFAATKSPDHPLGSWVYQGIQRCDESLPPPSGVRAKRIRHKQRVHFGYRSKLPETRKILGKTQ